MTEPESTEATATTAEVQVDPAPQDLSDAQLRAWAKENGVEGVPASGKLSAAWRETIVNAMAAALDPKEEASVEATSEPSQQESSTSSETTTETDPTPDGESSSAPTEEYRSVWQPPNTFVSSQAYTA